MNSYMTMRAFAAIGCLASAFAWSCLTRDDRPPPGSLLVTVSPSAAVLQGVQTEDGWSLTFSKAVVSLGRVGLGGREGLDTLCDTYSVPRYSRVFNLLSGIGQKLSLQFALGPCEVGFRMSPPDDDALLGVGATEADKTLMRTPGSDPYVGVGGISLMTDGTATRGGESKSFSWVFRQTYKYEQCKLVQAGLTYDGVALVGNEEQTFDIRVEVERLFRDDLKDSRAKLRFDPFATADADLDGLVTLLELTKVDLDRIRGPGAYGFLPDPEGDAGDSDTGADDSGMLEGGEAEGGGGDAAAGFAPSLADYVYNWLFPTLPRFRDTGSCTGSIPDGRHGGWD
jgi:hypothetical protein